MRQLILGESVCSLRRTIPNFFSAGLDWPTGWQVGGNEKGGCILAKERAGCLSLWNADVWQAKFEPRMRLVEAKLQADTFGEERLAQVQMLGRLLSSHHQRVELRGRRILIPEGFREFLGVERDPPSNEVMTIGAAVCIEIWRPAAWRAYLERRMPRFRKLFHELSS